MADQNGGVPKPRKLWIDSTPFTPPSYQSDQSCSEGEHASPAKVRLTHFTKKPVIDFGHAKIGKTVTRKLAVENPNPYEVEVEVEKFPWKKEFQINEKKFWVQEESFHQVQITWTPSESGNYREMVMIKYDGSFRVHALIVGHVDTPKKKRNVRPLRRNVRQRTPLTRRSRKFASSNCNEENVDPANSTEVEDGGKVQSKSHAAGDADSSPTSWCPKTQESFSSLRASLFPLHVVNGNHRDSSGSITAPTSPSGLEVPVIEDQQPSPLAVTSPSDVFTPADLTIKEESVGSASNSRETFCVDITSGSSNTLLHFTGQSLTGRPTFIMPPDPKCSTKQEPACEKSAVPSKGSVFEASEKSAKPVTLTPRSHRRSKTFTKEEKPKEKNQVSILKKDQQKGSQDKMSMLDYALSVIAKPIVKDAIAAAEKTSPGGSSLEDSLDSSNHPPSSDSTRLEPSHTTTTAPVCPAAHEALPEQLSSTYMHEPVSNGGDDGLPAPDISAITCPSPSKKVSKRKSPLSNSASIPKRAALEKNRASPASPSPARTRRNSTKNSNPGARGTPKGRALQRRRVAKAGEEAHRSLKVPPNNKTKLHTSPSISGVKRPVQEKAKIPKKRKVKVPPARLILRPSRPSQSQPLARATLPFSSRNMLYDDKWWLKQENAYTCWLNYILTPDEFKPSLAANDGNGGKSLKGKSLHHSAVFGHTAEKSSLNVPAISKETASLRAYQMQRRLNRLRRAACQLFESDAVIPVIRKIEEEVDLGRIKVRNDKRLWADLGNRSNVLSLLLSFNPLWLRVGLEATFGEALPAAHGNMTAISNFISKRLLNCEEIRREFAHPTVPNLFAPGYEEKMAKHTLKKFLILIFLLDQAKQKHLIDHDPCLFQKDSNFKNCKDILISFSRDLLRGEGDIIKHLSFFGYKVSHTQTYIDEFEYGINNIAVDLRDGIRLVRVVELLFQEHGLVSKLRVPAGSILQKKHNVGVALKALEEYGVNICGTSGKKVDSDHIVKGHKEMTLALLWNIAAHFQLVKGIDLELLRGEIAFLQKNLRLKQILENMPGAHESEDLTKNGTNSCTDEVSSLLLEWCRLVCSFKSIPVRNFGSSFTDGRALACLVSYYQSDLIRPSQICMVTTMSQWDAPPTLDDSTLSDFMQDSSADGQLPTSELLKNERTNLKLVQQASYELGGIPNLLRIDDICNTIPDDKVVRLLVSFLCVRLLDIRIEDRAARTIQVAWLAYRCRRKQEEEKRAAEAEKAKREAAAEKIQAAYRGVLQRRKFKSLKRAVSTTQKMWRTKRATRSYRRHFLMLRSAATKIQAIVRGFRARKLVATLKIERTQQNAAATRIQSHWRGWKQRVVYRKKIDGIVNVQRWFRATIIAKRQRHEFVEYRCAVVGVQRRWRATIEARKQVAIYTTKREASVLIQRAFRSYRLLKVLKAEIAIRAKAARVLQNRWRAFVAMKMHRERFLQAHSAVVILQCALRRRLAVRVATEKRRRLKAALVIQKRFRATLMMRQERSRFLAVRDSCITIQCAVRRVLAVKRATERIQAILLLQRRMKATLLMKEKRSEFLQMRSSAVTIQCAVRCSLAKKMLARIRKEHAAALLLQNAWNARKLMLLQRHEFCQKRSAAIAIQNSFRCFLAKSVLKQKRKERNAACLIQRKWRAKWKMRKSRLLYVKMRSSAIIIQCAVRRRQAQKLLSAMREKAQATITIQRWLRATLLMREQRSMYERTISSILLIQRVFLARKLLRRKKREKAAATTLQTWWRSTVLMREARLKYCEFRRSVIVIQSGIRRYLAVRLADERRRRLKAAVTIQRKWQATTAMRTERAKFNLTRTSVAKIQCAYRRHLAIKEITRRRRELDASLVIQRRWRATLRAKSVREEFIRNRTSALVVQSAVRCYLARKEKAALKRKSSAVTKIVAWWRATKQMHLDKEIFLRKRTAVVTIQCALRSLLAKRLAVEMRKRLYAVCVIQQRWRARALMQRQFFAYQRILSAALMIQCAYRRHLAVRTVSIMRERRNAAVVIQRKWRAVKLMREVRSRFLQQRHSSVVIQCAVRCWIAAKRVSRRRKEVKSAVVIQRRWRATLRMRQERLLYLESYFSLIVAQSVVRRYLARKKANTLRARLNATLVLQQYWRATLLMRREHAQFLRLRASAIVIQCAVRRYFAKKALATIRRRHEAAKCIQSRWRAAMAMRDGRQQFLLLRRSAIAIQCAVRRMLARKLVSRMRLELHSAVVIQRKWRATLLMRVERSAYLKAVSDVTLLQCAVRRYLAQRVSAEKRKRRDAALCIQRKFWATILMRRDRKQFLQLRQSAVRIQCFFRRVLACRVTSQKRMRLQAAVTIQQKWRAMLQMRAERSRYLKTVSCIVLMQRAIRCYLAKITLATLRRRHNAAITIQTHWRANVKMCESRNAYLRMRSSVTIMQRAYRSFSYRKAAREQLMRVKAVTAIQQWWKATVAMKIQRESYEKMRSSALILQCAFRTYQAAKTLVELRARNKAASTIQKKWRATLLMRNERDAFLVIRSCIITTQCCVRRFLAVRAVTKKRTSLQAALVLQTRWRAHIEKQKHRSKFLRMREAAVCIQRAWRAYVFFKLTSQQRKEIASATLIQHWWRATMLMVRERRNFLCVRRAAITIQTVVRGYMADKIEAIQLEKRRLHSTLLIQRVYRGYRARKAMSYAVAQAMKRCELANKKARQNPELKIGCRMTYALEILLSVQVYTHIYGCLNTLYDLSKLLPECCERISEAGGPEVLCRLIDSTNRSSCGNMIHEQSLKILLNLIQNPSTRAATVDTLRDAEKRQSTPPTELLVTILQRFREKGQRDRSHVPIFCTACLILAEFCLDPENVQFIRTNPRLVDTMRYVKKETESRYLSMMERNKANTLKKKRESVGYISLSSTFCEEPASPRRPHLLDVSTRETSFVQGHNRDSKFRSTPKSKAENVDPSAPPRPRAAEAGAKKVVRSLYGGAPVPPKVKQSLVPQLSNLNTGIRIHRSKKVTKPQSPKLHGFKSKATKLEPLKERKVADNNKAHAEAVSSKPAANSISAVQRPIREKAETRNEQDPLSCIRELYEIFE